MRYWNRNSPPPWGLSGVAGRSNLQSKLELVEEVSQSSEVRRASTTCSACRQPLCAVRRPWFAALICRLRRQLVNRAHEGALTPLGTQSAADTSESSEQAYPHRKWDVPCRDPPCLASGSVLPECTDQALVERNRLVNLVYPVPVEQVPMAAPPVARRESGIVVGKVVPRHLYRHAF